MPERLSYIVFTDFDGTITATDIGDALFQHFGDGEACTQLFRSYRSGEITAQECWQQTCATVNYLTRETLALFVSEQRVDPGFRDFVKFCEERAIPIVVLSDGFDVYISQILDREGMASLRSFSNKMIFHSDGTIHPEFPYIDSECKSCANCKRNHLLTCSSDDQVIVYIGDGTSDECPAKYADIVFAKNNLLRHCEKENITYHRFESFFDVTTKLQSIMEHQKPHKRRTAELARREVFMQG
jgi:2-hydroxy-3-keto-5-methylthiopentenyl-1-phosphate phosphatase